MYGRMEKKGVPSPIQPPTILQKYQVKNKRRENAAEGSVVHPQIPQPRQARPNLRDGLEAEWLEYPFLGHLVGNVSTLLQRDCSDDGVHGVRQNEFETGSLKVIRLWKIKVS